MWHKYVMEIKKDGYMKYISHLDMVKLFKNAFKKAEIKLAYSQGFNPHPKMGFAQPLSLGYSSSCELLEFETQESIDSTSAINRLQDNLPKGIEVLSCKAFTHNKSFAARTFAATYEISIPISVENASNDSIFKQSGEDELNKLRDAYLNQEKILTLKKQKKTGKQTEIDIKNMIRKLDVAYISVQNSDVTDFDSDNSIADNSIADIKQSVIVRIVITATLDSGSNSNLSPELVFSTFVDFAKIDTPREEVDIKRTELFFE